MHPLLKNPGSAPGFYIFLTLTKKTEKKKQQATSQTDSDFILIFILFLALFQEVTRQGKMKQQIT